MTKTTRKPLWFSRCSLQFWGKMIFEKQKFIDFWRSKFRAPNRPNFGSKTPALAMQSKTSWPLLTWTWHPSGVAKRRNWLNKLKRHGDRRSSYIMLLNRNTNMCALVGLGNNFCPLHSWTKVSAPQWVLQRGFHDRLVRRRTRCEPRKLHDFAPLEPLETYWNWSDWTYHRKYLSNSNFKPDTKKCGKCGLNPRKPACLQHFYMGFPENPPVVAVLYGLRSCPLGWWGHPPTRWTDPAVETQRKPLPRSNLDWMKKDKDCLIYDIYVESTFNFFYMFTHNFMINMFQNPI